MAAPDHTIYSSELSKFSSEPAGMCLIFAITNSGAIFAVRRLRFCAARAELAKAAPGRAYSFVESPLKFLFFWPLTVELISRFAICPIHHIKAVRLSFPTVHLANDESTFSFNGYPLSTVTQICSWAKFGAISRVCIWEIRQNRV